MHGNINIPFTELFIDTIGEHGMEWASKYYRRNGMSLREFRMWCRIVFL